MSVITLEPFEIQGFRGSVFRLMWYLVVW